MTLTAESSNSYSRLLPWKLRGLGVIIDDAIATKDLVELLRIICHDFVIFIKKSPVLRPLRITWEKDAKKQELLIKKAEQKLITSIRKAYHELACRIHSQNLSEDPFIKHFLHSIQDALFFRQAYGNPPFYVIALGMLNGLCRELLNRNCSDILDKIAEVEHSPLPHRKPIKATFCNKEVCEFLELKQAFALENSNALWLPWLLLQCVHERDIFFTNHETKMIIYVYEKCSTCKAAILFLKEHKVAFTKKEISKEPPSIAELHQMLNYQNDNLKKLFNTSGLLYKEMQLKKKLQDMNVNDAFTLLNQHGMLVKRPFLLGDNFGLLGFKEIEWSQKI